jgi:hypothetical protein
MLLLNILKVLNERSYQQQRRRKVVGKEKYCSTMGKERSNAL